MKYAAALLLVFAAVQGGRVYDRYKLWSLEDVTTGGAKFAAELYSPLTTHRHHQQHPRLVSSPFAVHMVLSMLYQGAAGATETLLTDKLHVTNPSYVAEGYSELIKRFEDSQGVEFAVANKIYISDKKHIKPGFNSTVVDQFRSEVESLDFSQPSSAVTTISTWLEGKSDQLTDVKGLLPGIVTETADMVVVNTVYFKGEWLHPLEALPECSHLFTGNGEDNVRTSGVSLTENFSYKEDAYLDAQIVEIPYTNEEYSMIFVLPLKKNGISDLENKVMSSDLTKILDGASIRKVNLTIPKFGLEYGTYLEQTLTEIGLGDLFEAAADFSGLVDDGDLGLTNIIHATSISVDEHGTDAAKDVPLPSFSGQYRSDPPANDSVIFNVDHQFMFFIVKKETPPLSKLNILLYGNIIDIPKSCP